MLLALEVQVADPWSRIRKCFPHLLPCPSFLYSFISVWVIAAASTTKSLFCLITRVAVFLVLLCAFWLWLCWFCSIRHFHTQHEEWCRKRFLTICLSLSQTIIRLQIKSFSIFDWSELSWILMTTFISSVVTLYTFGGELMLYKCIPQFFL